MLATMPRRKLFGCYWAVYDATVVRNLLRQSVAKRRPWRAIYYIILSRDTKHRMGGREPSDDVKMTSFGQPQRSYRAYRGCPKKCNIRYNKWESVSAVLLGLGKLNVKHLIMLRKVNLYNRSLKSHDKFLCDVFIIFLSSNVGNDDVLMPVFCSMSDAIDNVWLSFKNHVIR